jgi:hypothetical protein
MLIKVFLEEFLDMVIFKLLELEEQKKLLLTLNIL